jgi:flagellar protein FliO/FliZ
MSQAASLQAPPEPAPQDVAAETGIAVPAAGAETMTQAPATAPVVAPAIDAVVAIGTGAIAAPDAGDTTTATATDTTAAATLAARVEAPAAAMGTRPAVAHVGTPAPMPHTTSSAGSIGGALFALVLVVGLILVLGWLAKRMPGLGGTRGNPALRLVGSLALGPRDRVVVVEVGGTQLLLGVGSGGTRTLHTLTEPLPVAPPSKAAPAFAQLLAQHFGKKA